MVMLIHKMVQTGFQIFQASFLLPTKNYADYFEHFESFWIHLSPTTHLDQDS